MAEVPPAYWFGVFDGKNLADGVLLADKVSQKHVVGTIAEDMADGEDSFGYF
jgi:hypothetical protein